MESNQTAIEYLIQEFELKYPFLMEDGMIDQAKAMFKHQIELAFRDGWFDGNNPLIFKIENEQYYKEKYGK
jgi:hypothetical protein